MKNQEVESFINQTSQYFEEQEIFLTDSVIVDLDQLVNDVSELVSLPEVYLKIRGLMDDMDSVIDDFSIVVSSDPGLTSAVLKVVNSAFFGFTSKIDNISRALNLIGIGPLHDLVLSISAVNSLNLTNEVQPLITFWQRSIYCGVLSRLFSQHLLLKDFESLFVIGLLHEVGRLILFQQYPKESKQLVLLAQSENCCLTEEEKKVFGFDYGQVGQALLSEWGLPVKLFSIIGHHVNPQTAEEFIIETHIVHIAHQLAVNKYPGPEDFHYELDENVFSKIGINKQDIPEICETANQISLEMESFILGS